MNTLKATLAGTDHEIQIVYRSTNFGNDTMHRIECVYCKLEDPNGVEQLVDIQPIMTDAQHDAVHRAIYQR